MKVIEDLFWSCRCPPLQLHCQVREGQRFAGSAIEPFIAGEGSRTLWGNTPWLAWRCHEFPTRQIKESLELQAKKCGGYPAKCQGAIVRPLVQSLSPVPHCPGIVEPDGLGDGPQRLGLGLKRCAQPILLLVRDAWGQWGAGWRLTECAFPSQSAQPGGWSDSSPHNAWETPQQTPSQKALPWTVLWRMMPKILFVFDRVVPLQVTNALLALPLGSSPQWPAEVERERIGC